MLMASYEEFESFYEEKGMLEYLDNEIDIKILTWDLMSSEWGLGLFRNLKFDFGRKDSRIEPLSPFSIIKLTLLEEVQEIWPNEKSLF